MGKDFSRTVLGEDSEGGFVHLLLGQRRGGGLAWPVDLLTAASLAVVEPMSATLFSIMFLGEKPSVTAIVGIVLILSAVYLLSKEEL